MTRPTEPDWQLGADGWLLSADRVDSPNYDARPAGETIHLIVIHAISLPPGQFGGDAVMDLFTNRLVAADHPYFARIVGQRVSAHFFIRRDGKLTQCVSCLERAWHAGVSCWQGHERCNDFSLGIELEGDDWNDFEPAQYQALSALLTVLQENFSIEAMVGHTDIAPGRKTDPGPRFDWSHVQLVLPSR